MNTAINTQLNQTQIASQIVDILEDFYTGSSMDIGIGLNADGEVDYCHNVYSSDSDVVLELHNTEGGWNLGDWEGDIEDESSWTKEQKEMLVEAFVEWTKDTINYNDEIEVVFH